MPISHDRKVFRKFEAAAPVCTLQALPSQCLAIPEKPFDSSVVNLLRKSESRLDADGEFASRKSLRFETFVLNFHI